jgi:hypothetical protein
MSLICQMSYICPMFVPCAIKKALLLAAATGTAFLAVEEEAETLSEKYSLQCLCIYSKCPRTLTFSERESKAIRGLCIVKKCPICIYCTVPSYSKYPRTYIFCYTVPLYSICPRTLTF